MAEMLGNRFLPESVVSARRRMREQITQVREPVRRFREQNVPGPDIVGKAESQFTSLRNQFVRRDSVLEMIRQRSGSSGGSGGSSSSNGSSNNSSNQMV